jgi:ALG6, ALG8 glycosyltransferase family
MQGHVFAPQHCKAPDTFSCSAAALARTHGAAAHQQQECRAKRNEVDTTRAVLLCFGSIALLLVDHIHFQYNGMLMGVLIASIAAHTHGQVLLGGALFTVLLNLKHLYLVVAPVQFIFILRAWVWGRGWPRRLFSMAAVVLVILAMAVGPIASTGQIVPMLKRCAPIGSLPAARPQFSCSLQMREMQAQARASMQLNHASGLQNVPVPEGPATRVLGAECMGPLCVCRQSARGQRPSTWASTASHTRYRSRASPRNCVCSAAPGAAHGHAACELRMQ